MGRGGSTGEKGLPCAQVWEERARGQEAPRILTGSLPQGVQFEVLPPAHREHSGLLLGLELLHNLAQPCEARVALPSSPQAWVGTAEEIKLSFSRQLRVLGVEATKPAGWEAQLDLATHRPLELSSKDKSRSKCLLSGNEVCWPSAKTTIWVFR